MDPAHLSLNTYTGCLTEMERIPRTAKYEYLNAESTSIPQVNYVCFMSWGIKSLFPPICTHSSVNISIQFIYLNSLKNPPLLIPPVVFSAVGSIVYFIRKMLLFIFFFLILLPFSCLWVFPFSCITKQYVGLIRKRWSLVFRGRAKMTEKTWQNDADVHMKKIYSREAEGSLLGLVILT